MRDKVKRQCPQTRTTEEEAEPKRIRIEVPLLTSLSNVCGAQEGKRENCFDAFQGRVLYCPFNFVYVTMPQAQDPDGLATLWHHVHVRLTHNAGKVTRFLLHYLLFLQTWTETARFLYLVILILLEVCHSSTETALHSQSVTPGAIPSSLRLVTSKVAVRAVPVIPTGHDIPPPPPPPCWSSWQHCFAPCSQSEQDKGLTPVNGQGRQSPLTGGRRSGCLPPLVSFLWVQQTRGFFSEGSTNALCVEASNTLPCCTAGGLPFQQSVSHPEAVTRGRG